MPHATDPQYVHFPLVHYCDHHLDFGEFSPSDEDKCSLLEPGLAEALSKGVGQPLAVDLLVVG